MKNSKNISLEVQNVLKYVLLCIIVISKKNFFTNDIKTFRGMAKNIVVYTTWVVKNQVIEFIMIKITLKM